MAAHRMGQLLGRLGHPGTSGHPARAAAHPLGVASPSFAFWFIALTLVTFPGARATDPIAYRAGMPGVRVGQ